MTDDPIDEGESQGQYDHVVVDLDEVRIAWGRPRTPWHKRCKHLKLTYSTEERRVWCQDCQRTIEPFDALLMMIRHFEDMTREVRHMKRQASEALAAVVRRRAAKELERNWNGKMAPCCPHCRRGLLPEDYANGTGMAVSAELERARRNRAS